VRHRTVTVAVRCAISFLLWRIRPLQIRGSWHTGHCLVHTGQSGAPCWPLARLRVARRLRGRPLAQLTVGSPDSPVGHRTIWWIIAVCRRTFPESDDFATDDSPDSPMHHRIVRWIIAVCRRRVPRMAYSPEAGLAHRTLSDAPPDTVRCTIRRSGAPRPSRNSFSIAFLLFLALRHNTLVLKSMY
jgi:hypothetical protein